MKPLKAPFIYFGGKSRIAGEIWDRLGDPDLYIEPFLGSAACLLARPDSQYTNNMGHEIANDADGFLCVAPETKVLTGDMRWKEAGALHVGENLIGFDEENPGKARPGFRAPSKYRRWRHSEVLAVTRRQMPCYRLTFSDGTIVTVSENHSWLIGLHRTGTTGRGWRWGKTKNLFAADKSKTGSRQSWVLKLVDVTHQENSWEAGWLGGFF